jgi:hypothetical protein
MPLALSLLCPVLLRKGSNYAQFCDPFTILQFSSSFAQPQSKCLLLFVTKNEKANVLHHKAPHACAKALSHYLHALENLFQ